MFCLFDFSVWHCCDFEVRKFRFLIWTTMVVSIVDGSYWTGFIICIYLNKIPGVCKCILYISLPLVFMWYLESLLWCRRVNCWYMWNDVYLMTSFNFDNVAPLMTLDLVMQVPHNPWPQLDVRSMFICKRTNTSQCYRIFWLGTETDSQIFLRNIFLTMKWIQC